MKIGIITAMPEETRAVIRALPKAQKTRPAGAIRYHARFGGHEIVIAESGMGFANATATAGQLIAELQPDLVISAGFCGGIAAELQVGDAALAASLVMVSENGLQAVPAIIPALVSDFVFRQTAEGRRVFAGLFACTTTIMQKKRLADLLPPAAPYSVVEMESAAIALLAGKNGIPFVGLRTVSDPLDEELGFTLDEFCDGQMRIRIPKVLMTITRKPRIIPQLIRLAGNSRVAAASLSDVMHRFLETL